MAKKIDEYKFDDFDFDDFGDIDDGGIGDWKDMGKKQKARTAVETLKGGVVSGIKEKIFSADGKKEFIDKAFPKEYGIAYDSAINSYNEVKGLYDDARTELAKSSDKISSRLSPVVKKYNDKIPRKLRGPLLKWTQKANTAGGKWSKEDSEQLAAVNMVNDLFAKSEQNRLNRESTVETKVQSGLMKNQTSLLINLLKSAKATNEYMHTHDIVYKKKSLEIQYRQFFVQRKLLDTQQQMLKMNQASYEKLIHNTALPDIVKQRKSEVLKQMMLESTFGGAIGSFGNIPKNILPKVVGNLSKNLKREIGDLTNNITDAIDNLAELDEASEYEDGDKTVNAIRTGAAGLGKSLFGYGSKKVAKKYAKRIAANKNVRKGVHTLETFKRGYGRKINDYLAQGNSGNEIIDTLVEWTGIREILGNGTYTVRKNEQKQLNESALFDVATRKSIVEVIPSLLSEIHWETRAIRTGETSHGKLVYDFKKMVLTEDSKLVKDVMSTSVGNTKDRLDYVLENIFNDLGFSKGLSKEANETLKRQLIMAAVTGRSLDLFDIMDDNKSDVFGMSDKVRSELKDYLSTNYGFTTVEETDLDTNPAKQAYLKQKARMGMSTEAHQLLHIFATVLDTVNDEVNRDNNIVGELRNRAAGGAGGAIRKTGLTSLNKDGDEILNVARFVAELSGTELTSDEKRYYSFQDYTPRSNKKREASNLDQLSSLLGQKSQSMADAGIQGGKDGSGFSKGGYTGDFDTDLPVGFVHGQEYVFDANTVKRIGKENLDKIKNGNFNFGAERKSFTLNSVKKGLTKFYKSGPRIEQSKNELIVKIVDRFEKLKGYKPDNFDNLKSLYGVDHQVTKLMNRYGVLERVENAKLSNADKNKIVDNLKESWSRESIKTNYDHTVETVNVVKNKVKEKVSGLTYRGEDPDDPVNQFTGALDKLMSGSKRIGSSIVGGTKTAYGELSSIGLKRNPQGSSETKTILRELIKGAFGIGKELAVARFYGFKLVPWGIKKIAQSVFERKNFNFLKYGLWTQSGTEVKLLATGLKEGRYLNGNMEVIERPSDIHGDIYDSENRDADGNPTLILSSKEYRSGLFDENGKLVHKPKGIVSKFSNWAGKKFKNLAIGTLRTAGKLASSYIRITSWPGRKIINWVMSNPEGKVQSPETLAQIAMQEHQRQEQVQTNKTLETISDKLEKIINPKRMFNDSDGDGDRDGNAFDQIEANRNKKKGVLDNLKDKVKEKVKESKEKDGLFSKLIGALSGGLTFLMGGLIKGLGLLARVAIPALLGKLGIDGLIKWLKGDSEDAEPFNPDDPRADPTSEHYDPNYGKPTLKQKAGMWLDEKWKGLDPMQQLIAGGAATLGGLKVAGKAAKGAWNLTKKLAKKGFNKLTGRVAAGAAANAATNATSTVAGTAARNTLLTTAKTAARTAGGWILRQGVLQAARTAVVGGLTAVAGVVGLPVLVGVAAVGAIGYGAYKFWQKYKKDETFIARARMVSYGYDLDNKDVVEKLVQVEEYLNEGVNVKDNGNVSFKDGININKVMEMFGVMEGDEQGLANFREYFYKRFLPVYSYFITALNKHTGKTDIAKAEEFMTYEQMAAMLPDTIVKSRDNSPYEIMTSGFVGEDKVDLDREEVFDIYNAMSKKLRNFIADGKKNIKQKEIAKETKQVVQQSIAKEKNVSSSSSTKSSAMETIKSAASKAMNLTPISSTIKTANSVASYAMDKFSANMAEASSWVQNAWNKLTGKTEEAAAPAAAAADSGSDGGGTGAAFTGGKEAIQQAVNEYVAYAKSKGRSDGHIKAVLANAHRETGGFTAIEENMNYKSAARIKEIYGKTIRKWGGNVNTLVKNPQALANVVMDDRINNKGLGNNKDGDGYRYRGRGLIQITGRAMYRQIGQKLGIDLENNPDLINDPKIMGQVVDAFMEIKGGTGANTLEQVTQKIAPGHYKYNYGKALEHYNKIYKNVNLSEYAGKAKGGSAAAVAASSSTSTSSSSTSSSLSSSKSSTPAGTNTVLKSSGSSPSSSSSSKAAASAGTNSVLKSSTGYSAPSPAQSIQKALSGSAAVKADTNSNAVQPANTVAKPQGGTPWMDIAKKELGVKKPSARVGQYASDTGSGHLGNNYQYCATFVRWCLKQAGCELGNTNPMAKSFKGYGQSVDTSNPPYGAVIVMHWGNNKYHVAFSGGKRSDGKIVMLGGNQRGNQGGDDRTGGVVTESSVATSKIVYAGFPNGYDVSKAAAATADGASGQTTGDSGTAEPAKPSRRFIFTRKMFNFNGKGEIRTAQGMKVYSSGSSDSTAAVNQVMKENGVPGSGTVTTGAAPAGIVRKATGDSSFNVATFVKTLEKNGLGKSIGKCARYVRLALNAAGVGGSGGVSAYMYNGWLPSKGFHEISTTTPPQAGDIIVNHKGYNGKSKHGHIQGYTGTRWISDFKQNKPEMRSAKMYRHKSLSTGTPVTVSAQQPATADDSKPDTQAKNKSGSTSTGSTNNTNTPVNTTTNPDGTYKPTQRKNYTGIATFKDVSGGYASTMNKEQVPNPTNTGKHANEAYALQQQQKIQEAQQQLKTQEAQNDLLQKVAAEKATTLQTQQMHQSQIIKTNEELTNSTQILAEQLAVQRQMLARLESIDKHFTGAIANPTTPVQTPPPGEYGPAYRGHGKVSDLNQTGGLQAKKPGKLEPMSMDK